MKATVYEDICCMDATITPTNNTLTPRKPKRHCYIYDNNNTSYNNNRAADDGRFLFHDNITHPPQDSITRVTIPQGSHIIAKRAFESWINLEKVEFLSPQLWSIRALAFSGCTSLRTMMMNSIPTSVRRIDASAFCNCTSLTTVVLPEGLRIIQNDTFCGCASLTEIRIPANVKKICKSAFYGCILLENVQMHNIGLITIGSSAFGNCTSLETIYIPSTVTSIGQESFGYCTSLAQVDLPLQLIALHSRAFIGCKKLTTISWPSRSVGYIGVSAFQDCIGLRHLEFPTTHRLLLQFKYFQILVPLIEMVLQGVLLEEDKKECGIMLLDQWRSQLLARFEAICALPNGTRRKQERVHELLDLMQYYRMVEITSYVELSLWKKSINTQAIEFQTIEDKVDRTQSRFTCGAKVVLENVFPFLWDPNNASTIAAGDRTIIATRSIRPFNSPSF